MDNIEQSRLRHPSRITLFYPVRTVGGAQLAFARLARELAKRENIRVELIDHPDGFIRKALLDWGVNFDFTPWKPGSGPIDVGETTLLLSLSNLPESMHALRASATVRVLLWSLHPHAILTFFQFGFVYNRLPIRVRHMVSRLLEPITWKRTRGLLMDFEQANAILFMDGPNARFPLSLGFGRAVTHYLPVPIEPGRTTELRWAKGISLGWLGRLARDKSHTICAMVELCSRHAAAHGVVIDFHIVGDGPALGRLQALNAPGVRLHFPGVLREQALADYLGANVKVGFAMGTCLLEFSTLGIPVLVGDYSNDPITCELLPLRWFVPNEDYCLGEVIGERPRRAEVSLAEVARLCGDREAVRVLGLRCRDYAETNHRIDHVCDRLVGYLQATRYRFEAARPVVRRMGRPWGPRLARLFHRQPAPGKPLVRPSVSSIISSQ